MKSNDFLPHAVETNIHSIEINETTEKAKVVGRKFANRYMIAVNIKASKARPGS